jgi:hypothetical protein
VRLLREYMPICIIFANSRIPKLAMSNMHIMRIYRLRGVDVVMGEGWKSLTS